MFDVADRDDARLIVQGLILFAILVATLIALAAALGLAWSVFRLVGGL